VTAPNPVIAAERKQRWRTHFEESILPPLVALAIAAVVGDILILSCSRGRGVTRTASAR
jgi:hypothetical protein